MILCFICNNVSCNSGNMATQIINPIDISNERVNRFSRFLHTLSSDKSIKWLEILTLIIFVSLAWGTMIFFIDQNDTAQPLSPPFAAALLVLNLIPASMLIALWGRRIALKRTHSQLLNSKSKLHVRLVAIFSLITTIPVFLLVIFASLLFQNGVQFWFSGPARDILENAETLAIGYYQEKLTDVGEETKAMASDIRFSLNQTQADNPQFLDAYLTQVLNRKLSESAIVAIDDEGIQLTEAVVASDNQERNEWITPTMLEKLNADEGLVVEAKADRIEAATLIFNSPKLYLYTARLDRVPSFVLGGPAQKLLNDYEDMVLRSRNLQLQFNIALYIVSLFIIGIAIWIALIVADKLVKPVNQLVFAAQKVANGDLTARVAESPDSPDEIGILSNSFNRMTEQLEAQNKNLLLVNNQLNNRRAFMETVLESVSAGIVSLDSNDIVILANSNALKQLSENRASLIGSSINDISSDFASLLKNNENEAVIQIGDGPEPQTLAVNISRDANGSVITFEDISQQLADQKRAAWSDVARRIAHEIKNPLTPIQLAAERLKRRFSSDIINGGDIFDQLTDTIIRQVGDLRKIADEFSSFARMPKPIFREENISDIVRHSVFLHEVSKTNIEFKVTADNDNIDMFCDRRQMGQAITNVVKNATEAIQERLDNDMNHKGRIKVNIHNDNSYLTISITDNGIGLPPEKSRIVEPYVTTRSSGSGLGLAIVKKIVEEHFGRMSFDDFPGGGAIVNMSFNIDKLTERAHGVSSPNDNPENI